MLYDIDKYTGKFKDKPGMDSAERSKQELFLTWRNFIEDRGHKIEHIELLHELKNIRGMEEMRYNDLLAAGGMALMGAKSSYSDVLKRMDENDYDLSDFVG